MGLIEITITFLIYLLVIGVVYYLVTWVCGLLGIPLPMKAIQIVFAIFGLIVFLWLLRALIGGGGLPKLLTILAF